MLAVADVGAEEAAWQHGRTMPSDRNWPHDPRYDDAALEQFEERLRRANRASRPGYLRVKGATLLDHRDPAATVVAIRLLHRATESGHFLEVPWAHELLGKAYRMVGDLNAAEHHFRQCMATADEHRNGTTHVTELFLAEVLLQRDDRWDLAEVGLDGDHPRPSIGHREADVDRRDQGDRQGIDGGWLQPPEAERGRGLEDAPDDAP
jgi:hypothetical protein